jgi:hypothetical protein
MTGSDAMLWARRNAEPPMGAVRGWVGRLVSRLLTDRERGRRTQFYHDMLRLEGLAGTGHTSQAYGVAWDSDLSPVWQYPVPIGNPGLAAPAAAEEDGAGERGRLVYDAAAVPLRLRSREIGANAA